MFSSLNPAAFSTGLDGVAPLLAYLDPGSGSMFFQILIASLLSSVFFVRSTFTQVKGWLAGGRAGR
jgi:hypothetical protein